MAPRYISYHRLHTTVDDDQDEAMVEKGVTCHPPGPAASTRLLWQRSSWWSATNNRLLLFLFVLLAVYAIVLTTLIILPLHGESRVDHKERLSSLRCGNSSEEARAQGCKFDILTYHWIPQECFDSTTSDELIEWLNSTSRNFGAWPFFKDIHGKVSVSTLEELSDRYDTMTFTTREEHLAHCVFMLRRLRRAADDESRLLSAPSMQHIEHCQEALMGGFKDVQLVEEGQAQERGDKLGAIFKVRFGHCYEI